MRLHRWLDAESAVAIETLLEELVHDIAVACVVLLQHAQLPLVRPRPVDKSSPDFSKFGNSPPTRKETIEC